MKFTRSTSTKERDDILDLAFDSDQAHTKSLRALRHCRPFGRREESKAGAMGFSLRA